VDVLFVMIPLRLVLVVFAIWSFVWSVKHDQFEDLERQGWSILSRIIGFRMRSGWLA
jgi:cbb3-type cytochrome oxidase maturation protein